MKAMNITLMFDGNTEAVFNFYKSVFGGEFSTLMRMKEAPGGPPMPEDQGEKILYVSLPLGGALLAGMDVPLQAPRPVAGTNFTLALDMESEEETTRIFNGLNVNARVSMPLGPQFWASYFGMLTDQFGITWMLSYRK